MDVVNSVRVLFPDVNTAAEQYRRARPDKDARNLARRLANEEALYDRFVHKLALLTSTSSIDSRGDALFRNVESTLGLETAERLKNDLHQMGEFLSTLRTDLAQTSRNTEVLAKLGQKPTLSKDSFPTPLHMRLSELSKANESLGTYLVNWQLSLPLAGSLQTELDFELLLRLEGDQPLSGLQVSVQRFACACKQVAYGTLSHSGRLPQDTTVNLHHKSEHISILTQSLGNRYPSLFARDQADNPVCLEFVASEPPSAAISLADFMLHRDSFLNRRKCFELAFRLSSAVLILLSYPRLFNSSAWRGWDVLFDPEQTDERRSLYLTSRTRSKYGSQNDETQQMTGFLISSREPSLTLLGMRLIELAYGETLHQMRTNDVNSVHNEGEGDQDLLDLITAKRLLALHRIADSFGPEFEDVVNVCINQQYRERKGAAVTDLNVQDDGFLEKATVEILLPLYQQVRKNHGCICDRPHLDEPDQPVADKQDSQLDESKSRQGYKSNFEPTPENLATGEVPKADEVMEDNVEPAKTPDSHSGFLVDRAGMGSEPEADIAASRQVRSIGSNILTPATSAQVRGDEQEDQHRREMYDAPSAIMTVTTDSAYGWSSDHTEAPPNLPENSPLLLFQDVVVRILMRAFRSWKTHGNASEGPSGPAHRAEQSRKRARTVPRRDRNNEDEDEDDESPPGNANASGKKRGAPDGTSTFSCPFFKKDAALYTFCSGKRLTRIKDVKQHLDRSHQLPIYCGRCMDTFQDEDSRDEHILDCAPLVALSRKRPDGITKSQKEKLKKKAPSSQTPEEHWYGIWSVLFPESQSPASPYIDIGLMQNVLAFQSFFDSQGPQILLDTITASGAETALISPNDADWRAFLHRSLQDGIRRVFHQWTSSNGPANATGSSTQRHWGENNQQRNQGQELLEESRRNDEYSSQQQQLAATPSQFTTASSSHESAGNIWDADASLSLDGDSWMAQSHMDSSLNDDFQYNPMTNDSAGILDAISRIRNQNNSNSMDHF